MVAANANLSGDERAESTGTTSREADDRSYGDHEQSTNSGERAQGVVMGETMTMKSN